MGTGLVVNGLSTGGQIYQLKNDVSIEQAHKKGQSDGLDQVYFSANGNNYVLQGDNLKLGEVREMMKKDVPSHVTKLEGKPVEITFHEVDDEISSVGDGFHKNGHIGSMSATAAAVGVPLTAFSGLGWIITQKAGSKLGSAIASGGMYLGAAAVVGGIAGGIYYAGRSTVQGLKAAPDATKTADTKLRQLNSENNASKAGHVSVREKTEVAVDIATDIAIDTAFDLIFN